MKPLSVQEFAKLATSETSCFLSGYVREKFIPKICAAGALCKPEPPQHVMIADKASGIGPQIRVRVDDDRFAKFEIGKKYDLEIGEFQSSTTPWGLRDARLLELRGASAIDVSRFDPMMELAEVLWHKH